MNTPETGDREQEAGKPDTPVSCLSPVPCLLSPEHSFHRDALCQVAGFVHIATAEYRDLVRKQL
jgi:hypothetical protein